MQEESLKKIKPILILEEEVLLPSLDNQSLLCQGEEAIGLNLANMWLQTLSLHKAIKLSRSLSLKTSATMSSVKQLERAHLAK